MRLMSRGKLPSVKSEMERTGVQLLGIFELKWTGRRHFQLRSMKMFYSGHETHRRNGVAFVLQKDWADCVLRYNAVNDRILSIRIQGKPINITVIQAYAPTSNAEEEEIDDYYATLQEVLDQSLKKDVTIITGDFNAKVGKQQDSKVTGNFGLG